MGRRRDRLLTEGIVPGINSGVARVGRLCSGCVISAWALLGWRARRLAAGGLARVYMFLHLSTPSSCFYLFKIPGCAEYLGTCRALPFTVTRVCVVFLIPYSLFLATVH